MESLLEKPILRFAGSEDEVFAGKVQVCSQGWEFPFHGFAVDLNQELVARAQGLI